MSERYRPELLVGRILLFTAFILEWLFWRLVAGQLSNLLYAAIFAIMALPLSVALSWPPIYLSVSVFLVVLALKPTRFITTIRERRMRFWSFYEYDLAISEVHRLRKIRKDGIAVV